MLVTGRKIARALAIAADRVDLLPHAQKLWGRFLVTTYIRRRDELMTVERALIAAANIEFPAEDLAKVDEAMDLAWDPALHGVASNRALTLIPED